MAKDSTETKDTGVPKNDAYTGMLVISLLALILGSVLLYLDKSQYPENPPNYSAPTLQSPAKAPDAGKKDGELVPPGGQPGVPPGMPPDGKGAPKQ